VDDGVDEDAVDGNDVSNAVHQTNSRATAPSLEHIAKQSIGCGLRHTDHQTVCCRTLVVGNKSSYQSQAVLFYVQLRHDRPTDSREVSTEIG
jgi:hypothetical protein